MAACIPPAVAAGTGYALYKLIPDIYTKIQNIFANNFYKTVYITISQNKSKFVHLIKFMSKFKAERDCKAVILMIDDVEYEIPLVEIRVTSNNGNDKSEIMMKVHTDNCFNVTYIEVSIFKRDNLVLYSERRIKTLDNFIKQFPSTMKQIEPKKIETKQDEPIEKNKDLSVTSLKTPCNSPVISRNDKKISKNDNRLMVDVTGSNRIITNGLRRKKLNI